MGGSGGKGEENQQFEKLAVFSERLMPSSANGKHTALFLKLPSLPFLPQFNTGEHYELFLIGT